MHDTPPSWSSHRLRSPTPTPRCDLPATCRRCHHHRHARCHHYRRRQRLLVLALFSPTRRPRPRRFSLSTTSSRRGRARHGSERVHAGRIVREEPNRGSTPGLTLCFFSPDPPSQGARLQLASWICNSATTSIHNYLRANTCINLDLLVLEYPYWPRCSTGVKNEINAQRPWKTVRHICCDRQLMNSRNMYMLQNTAKMFAILPQLHREKHPLD